MIRTVAIRSAVSAVCLLAVLGLASCSSSDEATGATEAPAEAAMDACTLLSAEQIRAATGWDVDAGVPAPDAPDTAGTVCNWERADAEAAVHLQVHEETGGEVHAGRLDELSDRGGAREPRSVDVAGSDEAFVVESERLVGARVGDDYIQVSVLGGDDPEAALELAETVVAARG